MNNIIVNKPFFSVIIPTYNRALELANCLSYLTLQTFSDFEVIVCDDGSTDNTKEIIAQFDEKLNLKYIWEENWGGPARPRNNGIKLAQANWICFLDSDDWWYPNKLEICLKYVDQYNFIYHSLDKYKKGNKDKIGTLKSRKLKKDIFCDLIINGNSINNSSVVVKKDLLSKIGGISEEKELITVEDYDCWIKISKIDNKFKYITKSLGAYRVGNNISTASEKIIWVEQFITNKYIDRLNDQDKYQTICNLSYRFGRIYQKINDIEKALYYFKKSIPSKSFIIKLKSIFSIITINIKLFLTSRTTN